MKISEGDWKGTLIYNNKVINLFLEKERNKREYLILIPGKFINEKFEIIEKDYDLNKILYNFDERNINFVPIKISNEIEEFFVLGSGNPNFNLNVKKINDEWYIKGNVKYYPSNNEEMYDIIKKESGIDLEKLLNINKTNQISYSKK